MMDIGDYLAKADSDRQDTVSQVPGVMTGTVKKNWDKDNPGKIQVELHYGEPGKTLTSWVRVMQPYTGKAYGSYFLPEIGTEVVVGFIRGDINSPIILGSLWNNVSTLPDKAAVEKNTIKKVRTKAGHEICFDEEEGKEKITVQTVNALKIEMDDAKKTITLSDKETKNTLSINGDQGMISLSADKTIELAVGSDKITISSSGIEISASKITLNAKNDLTAKGTNISLTANAQVTIKGSGGITVQSSGITQVKGSMVKVN